MSSSSPYFLPCLQLYHHFHPLSTNLFPHFSKSVSPGVFLSSICICHLSPWFGVEWFRITDLCHLANLEIGKRTYLCGDLRSSYFFPFMQHLVFQDILPGLFMTTYFGYSSKHFLKVLKSLTLLSNSNRRVIAIKYVPLETNRFKQFVIGKVVIHFIH